MKLVFTILSLLIISWSLQAAPGEESMDYKMLRETNERKVESCTFAQEQTIRVSEDVEAHEHYENASYFAVRGTDYRSLGRTKYVNVKTTIVLGMLSLTNTSTTMTSVLIIDEAGDAREISTSLLDLKSLARVKLAQCK